MTVDSADGGARRPSIRRLATGLRERARRLDRRRWGALLAVLVAFVAASIVIGPRMSADGDVRVATYDLTSGQTIPGLRTRGEVQRGPNGLLVRPAAKGRASFLVSTSSPQPGDRTTLIIAAGGEPGSDTKLSLVDAAGNRHLLGRPLHWREHKVDISRFVGGGS